MLDELDTEPWADLEHAYGSARDVPDLIRALVSGGPDADADAAAARLHASLHHEGSYVEATAVAVPYLVEALGSDRSARAVVLRLLAAFGGAHRDDTVDGYDPYAFRAGHEDLDTPPARATVAAVRAGHPTYLTLLADDDPAVRALAAYVIVGCPDAAVAASAELAARVRSELDDAVRAAQVFALGRFGGRSVRVVLRDLLADRAAMVRYAAAIELARGAADQVDGTVLGLLAEAAGCDVADHRGTPCWGGRTVACLAAVATAELARVRPGDAEAVLREALGGRLRHGQRALTPYFWRDGPPDGTDRDELIRHDTALRDLVTVLTPLVFGDLVDREQPVTRAELTDDQVEVLRWTVDADLPVPVAAVPWPDAARMERFLDGPVGSLEAPLTVTRDDGARTAPTWLWFWDLDVARSEPLDEAVTAALRAQRSPRELVALARDTFTGAYRRDAWPRRPIALIRRALDGYGAGATGVVADDLAEWARQLDGHSDGDQTRFVLALLAGVLAERGETLPEHLDGALARAITASDQAAGLLDPLAIDRRSRIIARVRNPYWLRKVLGLGDPEEIAHRMIQAIAADPESPGERGTRDLLVALGPAAVAPLSAQLGSPAADGLSPRHRALFTEALHALYGDAEHELLVDGVDDGLRVRLVSPGGAPLVELVLATYPNPGDLAPVRAALATPERTRLALTCPGLPHSEVTRLQHLLSDLGIPEVRSGGCTVTRRLGGDG